MQSVFQRVSWWYNHFWAFGQRKSADTVDKRSFDALLVPLAKHIKVLFGEQGEKAVKLRNIVTIVSLNSHKQFINA